MEQERRSKVQKREPKAGVLVPLLLAWFRQNARDLPWRHTTDPYAIWISEIMLQQTQVKTVIPYWTRWMRELPTVQSLALAPPERVLKLWEGLGYYSRAKNLQRAATVIVAGQDGCFPNAFDEVLALPGIGRYTAGAICSIAFNQPSPVLDGNVVRVLARLYGIRENPRGKETNAGLWRIAEALVRVAASAQRGRERNCSRLNQAMMELGATICTPRRPKCLNCPVQNMCTARRDGRTAELPNLGRRPPSTQRRFVAFIARKQGRFLVRQRPANGINAHLWEFPNAEVTEHHADVSRLASALLGRCRISREPCFRLKHTIMRCRISLDVFSAAIGNGFQKPLGHGLWTTRRKMQELAFASAHRKIVERLKRESGISSRDERS